MIDLTAIPANTLLTLVVSTAVAVLVSWFTGDLAVARHSERVARERETAATGAGQSSGQTTPLHTWVTPAKVLSRRRCSDVG